MYDILKNKITSKNFDVATMTETINTLYADSELTKDQRDELLSMMPGYSTPESEAPELAELYKRLLAEVKELKATVQTQEKRIWKLEHHEEEPEELDPGVVVPDWELWDGINQDWYTYGDVAQHNGAYWIDTLQGMINTWEPGTPGVDERYWKEITKEQAEGIISGDMTVDEVLGR